MLCQWSFGYARCLCLKVRNTSVKYLKCRPSPDCRLCRIPQIRWTERTACHISCNTFEYHIDHWRIYQIIFWESLQCCRQRYQLFPENQSRLPRYLSCHKYREQQHHQLKRQQRLPHNASLLLVCCTCLCVFYRWKMWLIYQANV